MNHCGKALPKKTAFALFVGILTFLFSFDAAHSLPFLLSGSTAEAAVKYVTQGGAGTRNGSNWGNAFGEAELPAAIQGATAGDEFWIAEGIYRPSTGNDADASFILKSGVALYGGFAGTEVASSDRDRETHLTILTGDLANDDTGKVHGVTVSADLIVGTNSKTVVTGSSNAVLNGVTVTGGSGGTGGYGGGMYNNGTNPTVTGCTFAGNSAGYGGGMYNNANSSTATECTFTGNRATAAGGGMYNHSNSPVVTGCTFTGNRAATEGGGMSSTDYSNPSVTNCTFSGNVALQKGGGMYSFNYSYPAVTNCTFANNLSQSGGGMFNYANPNTATNIAVVTGCTFTNNSTTTGGYGGGMFNYSNSPAIVNCTFSGNTADYGGGMYNYMNSRPKITNCTFADNDATNLSGTTGGGMYNNTDMLSEGPIVTNSIFWNTSGGEIANYTPAYASVPVLTNCIVQNGDIGTGTSDSGTITTDPQLGPLADNGGRTRTRAIPATSSAIDAGLDVGMQTIGLTTITVPGTDQRGTSRPQGFGVDIGAYEYTPGKVLTVAVSGDGTVSRNPSGTALTSGNEWEYPQDTPVSLTASAVAPWYFVEWSGDASGTSPSATVTMNAAKSVTALFARTWTITATAGTGGSIAPSGNVSVAPGANQAFTVTPGAGYAIADVTVDGTSVGALTTHTFLNVTTNHTIAATFTADPTPTTEPTATPTGGPTPTSGPDPTGGPTPTGIGTPTPFPSPDPAIPLPKVTVTLTLLSGGQLLAGPMEITNPDTLAEALSSPSLLAELAALYPTAIAAGEYNLTVAHLLSLLAAHLDLDESEISLLFEITTENVPDGYTAATFLLARTFDEEGNPTGFTLLPHEEDASALRHSASSSETRLIAVADNGEADGNPDRSLVLPNLAIVVVVVGSGDVPTSGPTGTGGGGGGCETATGGDNESFGGALPVLLLLAVPLALLLRR